MENNGYGLLRSMEKCGHFLYHRRGGKRGQHRILKILWVEGKLPQRELQERLGIRAGSLSEILSKLEEGNLILRSKDKDDKRAVILELTQEGQRQLEANREKLREEEQVLFSVLTEAEKEELNRTLIKILSFWEQNFEENLRCPGNGHCGTADTDKE